MATRSGGNRLSTVNSLETLDIAVFATDPHSVDDVVASTQRLGELTGAGGQGSRLADALRTRLSDVAQRLGGIQPTPVLLIVWLGRSLPWDAIHSLPMRCAGRARKT